MSLDLVVAQQQYRMNVLSRAVNEPTGWEIEVGGLRVPARRILRDDRVVFVASLPDLPFRTAPDAMVLLHRGEAQLYSEYVGDGTSVVWEMRLVDPVGV